MSQISVLIVTGSFVLPNVYDTVVNAVKAKGIEIRALHLLTVGLGPGEGREGPPATMYDDATFIGQEVDKLADQGKHVILIGHSYGGVPTSQSVQGRSLADRQKQGKPGGIVRLGYLTSLVPEIGQSGADLLATVPPENQAPMEIDEKGWMLHVDSARSAKLCLSKIPLEESEPVVRCFTKHSAVSFANKLTYAGYNDVPVSYLLCEDDLCIPKDVQQKGIDLIERQSGRKVTVTKIDADHGPNYSAPEKVVNWILSVVEEAKI